MTDATVNEALTPARVAHLPAPGTNAPVQIRFSPDGRLISFLYSDEGSLSRELWAWDAEASERELLVRAPGGGETDANVSREEAMRRERQRQRGFGVTGYAWAVEGDRLLVPVRGALYIQSGRGAPGGQQRADDNSGSLRMVVDAEPPCIDPQLNRDGSAVAFVREGELYSLDLTREGAQPVRLTYDATPAGSGEQLLTNGLAEFVAQEEMGRSHGFWWSRDGASLAFEQVDNGPVTPYTIVNQGEDTVEVEVHRYPFAGERNAAVRLGVVLASGGDVSWLPLEGVTDGDGYVARVDWAPDGCLLVQVITRDQRTLDLRRIDPQRGVSETLFSEIADDWLNLHDDLRCIPAADGSARYELLWSSERSGSRQLYLYSADGRLIRQLTPGPWPVDGVLDVDEKGRSLYFAGSESPLEAHVYRVGLDGGAVERLTTEAGMHSAVFSADHSRFVESCNSMSTPPVVTLRTVDGKQVRRLFAVEDPEIERLGLRPPELVTVRSRDGETLYGALYRPLAGAPATRYPVLISVYGGPHVQMVNNSWGMTADLRAAHLRAPLLLLHGMLDENVHFRHTARLINALNEANRPYDLAVFPGERHGPRSETQRAALERRLSDFFQAHLEARQ